MKLLWGIIVFPALLTAPAPMLPGSSATHTDTLKVWNAPADGISADRLGHYYLFRAETLIMFDNQGDSAYSWSEPQSGSITLVDTGDPMRILLYQKDFNLLRFLNNRLAPLSAPIRLDDLGFPEPLALAASLQGGFWVIDRTSWRLKLIDRQNRTVLESVALTLPQPIGNLPLRLIESGDKVRLLIPGREIQEFDLFANLIRKIPVKALSFQATGDRLVLVYPDRIARWKDAVTPEEELARTTGPAFREACLFQDKLMVSLPDRSLLLRVSKK